MNARLAVDLDGVRISTTPLVQGMPLDIGSSPANDIVLADDLSIDDHHLQLLGSDGRWTVRSTTETNAFNVNGQVLRQYTLIEGQPLQCGRYALTLLAAPMDEEPPAHPLPPLSPPAVEIPPRQPAQPTIDPNDAPPAPEPYPAVEEPEPISYLVINSGPSAGLSVPLASSCIIGLGGDSDLVLDDPTLTTEHLAIRKQGRKWTFTLLNQDGTCEKNGKTAAKGTLKNGDVLLIGNTECTLRLPDDGAKSAGGPSVLVRLNALLKGRGRLVLLAGLCLFMLLIVISLFSGDDEPEPAKAKPTPTTTQAPAAETPSTPAPLVAQPAKEQPSAAKPEAQVVQPVPEPVQPAVDPQPAASQQMAAPTQTVSLLPEDNDEAPNADGPELPLPQKRQRARLLYQAKNFAQAQEYDKAISRLEGVLALVPEDQETKALLTSYQAKQNEVAQTAAQRQEAMNRIRVQIDSVVAQAKERLHTKQFDEASALLAQLSDPTTDYPELARDYAKVGQMEKKIAEARQLVLTQQQEALSAEEAAKEAVRRAYQQGIQAYEEKNFTQAMAHLELAANSDIDVPETALAASYLKGLKDSMDSGIQADVDRGFALYRIQDYPGALRVWSRVLKFFPDHPDVRPIFDTIQPIQTEKARHIYQEGLVYEGIDNIDLAKQKWNEVLKVLPVEESEYYSKAKEKLAAYGQSDE